MDHFIMKLRLVRHLPHAGIQRAVLGGDPTWVTESIGGMGIDGQAPGHAKCLSAICIR